MMKPIIILEPDMMEPDEIQQLKDNGLCVVVAKDPGKVRFMDPIPAAEGRTQLEEASIRMSRILLNKQWRFFSAGAQIEALTGSQMRSVYLDCLLSGTHLSAEGSREEQEKKIVDEATAEELRKIAREEAREEAAERRRLKAEEAAAKKAKSKT